MNIIDWEIDLCHSVYHKRNQLDLLKNETDSMFEASFPVVFKLSKGRDVESLDNMTKVGRNVQNVDVVVNH